MQSTITKYWFFIVVLCIGIFFKAYKIDHKYFWFDEVATIWHTSGNQIEPPDKNIVLPITYFKDQLKNNKHGYTLKSEIKGLFTSVNLNPLHYPFLMIWTRIVGDEPVMYRWFNVFVFLLTLPILFILAQKIFDNQLAGWVVVTLYSCSPYINYFTHEARYHITWAFFIILTSYLNCKALEREKIGWWIGVALAAVGSMYISLISMPVLLGLFLWAFIYYNSERKKIILTYSIAFLFYLPWLYWLYVNKEEINTALAWHSVFGENVSLIELLFKQFFVSAQSFGSSVDFMTFKSTSSNFIYSLFATFYPLILLLISIVYSIRNKTKYAGRFLLFVFIPMILFFVVSDSIRGVGGSFVHRYQMINIVGIILFISYYLSVKMTEFKFPFYAAYILIIGMGIFSMFKSVSNSPGVLNGDPTIREGNFYSSKESPLIITDFEKLPMKLGYLEFLEVANAFESNQIDFIYATPDINNLESLVKGKKYSDIFVSFSSDELLDNLKLQYGDNMKEVKIIAGIAPIWKLENSILFN